MHKYFSLFFQKTVSLFLFSVLFVLAPAQADNNSINGTCPGEIIEQIDQTTTDASHTENGGIGSGGNDRYRMTFPSAGTLDISVTNRDASRNANYYFYLSKNSCGDNDSDWNVVSRAYGNTHSHSLSINAGDTVYVRLQSISSEPNSGRQNYALALDYELTVGNTPPTADNQNVTVVEDRSASITLTASDSDSDPLTYHTDSAPTHGVLSGTAPNLTYTPNTGYTGPDSFTFHVNDGTDDSTTATVSITVVANIDPVADDQSVNVTKNSTNNAITLTGSDGNSDPLTYSIVSGPSHGSLGGTPPNVTYTPTTGYTGADSFTFIVNDGSIDSTAATVSITVANAPLSFSCANPKPFTMIYQINAFGDIAQIGNTNLCSDNNYDGRCEDPGGATNNSINMINSDYDGDASTFNSTGARLELPTGAEILYAGLLWQGYFAGSVSDATKEEGSRIKFKYEGAAYQSLTADEMNWVYFSSTRMYYQGYKNVTSYVKSYGDGYYWAADITSTLGKPAGGSFGAWSLSVAYKDDKGVFKNMTFYHGYQAMAGSGDISGAASYASAHGCDVSNTGVSNDTGATLTGFITPKSGTVDATLTVFTGEGDIGLSGDTVSVTDISGTPTKLSNGVNPQTNVMNATISFNGSIVNTGKPYISYNSLGIDIDTYDIGSIISNQQSSTDVNFHTSGDGFMPGFFAFSADLYVPNICYDYSYQQLGRAFTEDNNGSQEPHIKGYIVPTQPITVGIYFRNQEDSDIKASNNLLSVYDIGSTSSITYIPNSTAVTYATNNSPTSATPAGQSTHSFTNLDLGDIGGQQYIYAYYQIDPQTNNYIDIPLNADVNYTLNLKDISGNIIPITYKADLGSGRIPLCRGAGGGTGYEPIYGSFNVEDAGFGGTQRYNLYTQASGRPWDSRIYSYAETNDYNDRNDSAEWLKVEIIDTGAYHDPQASCTERDSNITQPVTFYFTDDGTATGGPTTFVSMNTLLTTQGINQENYYNIAVEEAAYRVWRLVNPITGQMMQAVCNDQTLMWDYFDSADGATTLATTGCATKYSNAKSVCDTSTPSNAGGELDLFLECVFPAVSVPVCSRDNFAIRPESFVTTLIDDNTSTVRQITQSKQSVYNGGPINLAGGYPYRFDINATSHADDLFGDQGVRGYINTFGSFNLSTNRAYMAWTPSVSQVTTGCNAPYDQNLSFHLQDGTTYNPSYSWMSPSHASLSNIGEYVYQIKDERWTRVDYDSNYMGHHTGPYFNSGTDCTSNSSYVPQTTNTALQVGCLIVSAHTNQDTGTAYVDLNIRAYPYEINVSDISDVNSSLAFFYMNNVAANAYTTGLAVDGNYSVNLYGILRAVGKDGTVLSNFVQNCYAEPVIFDYTPSISTAGGLPLRWRETNSSGDTDGTTLPVSLDGSGAFLQANQGASTLDLHINFDRNRSVPVNPVNLVIDSVSANCADTASTPGCQTNADGVSNHTALDTNSSFDSTHLFVYGRSHAPRYRVECLGVGACSTTSAPNQALNLYEEIYYDISSTIDANATLSSTISTGAQRSVDAVNWYTNNLHQDSDGKITSVAQYYNGAQVNPSPITTTQPTANTSGVSTTDVSYDGSSTYPYKATMGLITSPWLVYNRFDNTADHNEFDIEFNAAQLGGDASKSDANLSSPNTSRRIQW